MFIRAKGFEFFRFSLTLLLDCSTAFLRPREELHTAVLKPHGSFKEVFRSLLGRKRRFTQEVLKKKPFIAAMWIKNPS
jgi:hypothetical protein